MAISKQCFLGAARRIAAHPIWQGVALACILTLAVTGIARAAAPLKWSSPIAIDTVGPHTNALEAISCPATNFCVAGGGSGVFVSDDPSGGKSAWPLAITPPLGPGRFGGVDGVSCPTTSFCVAAGPNTILTSTNPAAGSSAWHVTRLHLAAGGVLRDVSCASKLLCVAFEEAAGERRKTPYIFTSTHLAGGTGAWIKRRLKYVPRAVTCIAPHTCLLGTEGGNILNSTGPAARHWKPMRLSIGVARFTIGALACRSARSCFAAPGAILPAGPRLVIDSFVVPVPSRGARLPEPASDRHGIFTSGSCVASFCAFAASDGRVFTGDGSVTLRTHWKSTRVDSAKNADHRISCPARNFCVLIGSDGNLFIGH